MTCQSPRCRPAAWTFTSTWLSVGTGLSMAASFKTSAEPYRSWTMACIVVSQAVAGSGPWSTGTAVTGADVVAFGASMEVLSSIGSRNPPQGRDRPSDPPQRPPESGGYAAGLVR